MNGSSLLKEYLGIRITTSGSGLLFGLVSLFLCGVIANGLTPKFSCKDVQPIIVVVAIDNEMFEWHWLNYSIIIQWDARWLLEKCC